MQRYILDETYPMATIELTGEPYHHIVRVMRMQAGDQVYLVFRNQVTIVAEISEITENSVFLEENTKKNSKKNCPLQSPSPADFRREISWNGSFKKEQNWVQPDLSVFPQKPLW